MRNLINARKLLFPEACNLQNDLYYDCNKIQNRPLLINSTKTMFIYIIKMLCKDFKIKHIYKSWLTPRALKHLQRII